MRKAGICALLLLCVACGRRSVTFRQRTKGYFQNSCNDSNCFKVIADSLQPWVVFGYSVVEFAELMADTPLQGMQSYEMDTLYDDHCLLCVSVSGEWSAAYIQHFEYYRLFDKYTGHRLFIRDLIVSDSIGPILNKMHETIVETVRAGRSDVIAYKETIGDTSIYDDYVQSSLEYRSPEALENFYVDSNGITFVHEFMFGHAFWNLSPGNATLTLSPEELRNYIKANGPLHFWLANGAAR